MRHAYAVPTKFTHVANSNGYDLINSCYTVCILYYSGGARILSLSLHYYTNIIVFNITVYISTSCNALICLFLPSNSQNVQFIISDELC